mmetsp:Transcript_32172/g.44618  ORF Transcript_32172/g.44618 Transcript_32172/m.44618 type:complete len:321 (+) Transcript_32172:53-1015(+)|eukprot:CAMPEP_0196583474 /NCGR_PEP_ID=MMETSP1081-20130531/43777_1 /TAXON_ID=36882 /ORGANISM="Pyramimonas amylifera, Strain CCMP720" /LENGTH=320 /DNA_ID=CAMNT_0041904383 /DNA_START=53 /DNA_END=1015 /DNA_ORIENTATION=+
MNFPFFPPSNRPPIGTTSVSGNLPCSRTRRDGSLRISSNFSSKTHVNSHSFSSQSKIKSLVVGGMVGFGALALACESSCALEDKSNSDRLNLWLDKWKIGQLNWHIPDVNKAILDNEKYWLPSSKTSKRVLIPLCGKTADIPYLAGLTQVDEVVGVEGASLAAGQFAEENPKLNLKRNGKEQDFDRYNGEKVKYLVGDFFDFEDPVGFDKVWDRGSLVAINPSLRSRYAAVIDKALKPGGQILIEALHRKKGTEESRAMGPPFSLSEAELKSLFPKNKFRMKKMSSKNLLKEKSLGIYQRFKEQGLSIFNQDIFIITKKE